MRHYVAATVVTAFFGCTTTHQTLSNRVATLGPNAKPGDTPVIMVKSGVFEYPRFARANGIEGVITISVLVKADGTGGDIRVLKRDLNIYRVWVPGRESKWDDVTHIFDGPVEDMVKGATWKPAVKDGVPGAERVTIPLSFKLERK